jgi:hypothetical protein
MTKKLLVLLCVLAWARLPVVAQASTGADSLFQTPAQNSYWLAALKEKDKVAQWAQIRSRFFVSPQRAYSSPVSPMATVPVLVVVGFVVDMSSEGTPLREVVARQLTPKTVKTITVIEREPEEWYANKAFTGLIIIELADKPLVNSIMRTQKQAEKP